MAVMLKLAGRDPVITAENSVHLMRVGALMLAGAGTGARETAKGNMADHPDLSAELDAAEDIVTGRAEKIETEWGVRYEPELSSCVAACGAGPDNERRARHEVACWPDTAALVRRTVTYGPWETTEDNDG